MLIHEVNEQNYKEEIEKGEAKVQEKFDVWERLGKLNISIDEFKKKAAYLLRDPTIWAYANLFNQQNKRFKSYYYQDLVNNDPWRLIHVTAANQTGKTVGLQIKALHHSIFTNNASALLISSSEKQAIRILDEMKWLTEKARLDFDEIISEVSNRTELHLIGPDNKSISAIRTFPPTKSILGFAGTFIGMDETGFWEKDADLDPISYYQQCVEPRTNATKNWTHPFLTMGQIESITNPNGQDGLAWWLRNNKEYHQYIYNWLCNPLNTLESYDFKKNDPDFPPIRFASVYAATYLAHAGGFITLDQYERFRLYNSQLVLEPGMVLFLGGDFASEEPKSRNTDWSVLYGVVQEKNRNYPQHPRIRLVYRAEFPPRTPRTLIYDEIERLKNLPGITLAKFAYDKVGVGDSVKRDLMGRGTLTEGQIEALPYSLPNKSDVYLKFQSLFQQDMIEGFEIPKLKEQLLALKVERPTGSVHIKVHHKTEGVKDDEPDALANACFVASIPLIDSHLEFVPRGQPVATGNLKTVICPKCEEEGNDGYFQAKAVSHFDKVLCRKHQE